MPTPKDQLIGKQARLTARQAGVVLIEVLVAMVVFSLSMSAIVLLFFSNQTGSYDLANSRNAMQYARSGIEAVRIIRDRDWNELSDGSHGLQFANNEWEFFGTSDSRDNLTRIITITTDADGLKHIESKITWTVSSTHVPKVTINEILAPSNEGLFGDWKKMRLVGSYDAGSNGSGTDVAYAKNYVYVANSVAAASTPDLFIFDVASHSNPILKSSLDVEDGLKAIAVSGSYAYAIEENSPDFFIINIASPVSPYVVSKLTLAGGKGRTISTRDSYVYVGTAINATGAEFFTINVSNKNSPSVVGSVDVGTDINKISLLRDVAYCATSNDTKELWLMDLTDPLNPVASNSYDGDNNGDGTAIHAKSDSRLYFGRIKKDSADQIYTLDATNTDDIVRTAHKGAEDDVHAVLNVGTLLFVGTEKDNKELQNYYVGLPDKMDHYDDLNISDPATGLAYSNNYIFASVRGPKLLQVITSKPY